MLEKRQKKCIKLMIESDLTQKEIATMIKVSEQTICSWKKDDEFSKEYDKHLRVSIRALAGKAYRTLEGLLYADSESARLAAAKDILDRAGFKSSDRLEIEGNVTATNPYDGLSVDELKALANRCVADETAEL